MLVRAARRARAAGRPGALRRGRGVVTWKSVETVGTFLRLVGGGSSLLELEARQVSRSVRGDLNRVLNAESANLERAVAAAARQLEAIDALEADGRLAEQPYVVRLVADARREEPGGDARASSPSGSTCTARRSSAPWSGSSALGAAPRRRARPDARAVRRRRRAD